MIYDEIIPHIWKLQRKNNIGRNEYIKGLLKILYNLKLFDNASLFYIPIWNIPNELSLQENILLVKESKTEHAIGYAITTLYLQKLLNIQSYHTTIFRELNRKIVIEALNQNSGKEFSWDENKCKLTIYMNTENFCKLKKICDMCFQEDLKNIVSENINDLKIEKLNENHHLYYLQDIRNLVDKIIESSQHEINLSKLRENLEDISKQIYNENQTTIQQIFNRPNKGAWINIILMSSFSFVGPYSLDSYYIIPAPTFLKTEEFEESSGGITIFFHKDNSKINKIKENEEILAKIIAIAWMRENTLIDFKESWRKHALRSAVAAIMSRNMSHHIGSHILTRITFEEFQKRLNDLDLFERLQSMDLYNLLSIFQSIYDKFLLYIQQKADFLAEIATEPLFTGTTTQKFFAELILPFVTNTLLMDNIAANEGIRYEDSSKNKLKIKTYINGEEMKAKFECECQEKHIYEIPCEYPYLGRCKELCELKSPKIEPKGKDVEVELPGVLGKFALWNILENFIRNSAKHEQDKLKCKDLEIYIKLEDENDPDYYTVKIWNNVTNPAEKRKNEKGEERELWEILNEYKNEDIIEATGELKKKNWGIAEIKICATLLRGISEFTNENLRESVEILKENQKLIYKFKMMKPKRIAFYKEEKIDDNKIEELKKDGIWLFNDIERFKNATVGKECLSNFKFVVFDTNKKDEIEKFLLEKDESGVPNIEKLPYRIIWITKKKVKAEKELENRILIVNEKIDISILSSEEITKKVWLEWLKKWNTKVKFFIYLQQDKTEFPTAELSDKSFNKYFKIKILHGKTKPNDLEKKDFEDNFSYAFIDRHGIVKQRVNKIKDKLSKKLLYYQFIDKGSPDILTFLNPNLKFDEFLYKVLESSLVRGIIFDERLSKFCEDKNLYKECGIFIGKKIVVKSKNKEERIKIEDGEGFKLTVEDGRVEIENKKCPLDFIIIHQGLIDTQIKGIELFIKTIKNSIPYVIITSGRGIPHNLHPETKFLHFSTIKELIMAKLPAKYRFTEIIMNLVRRG